MDDEGKLLKDPLRLGNNEAPKELGYFRELCSLVAIKAKIIRSLYMVQKADCFPDSTVVLQTEDLLVSVVIPSSEPHQLIFYCCDLQLDFWEKVPNYLKIETAPDAALYRLQAHLLRCRYNNTRIMLYRPFLFHVNLASQYTLASLRTSLTQSLSAGTAVLLGAEWDLSDPRLAPLQSRAQIGPGVPRLRDRASRPRLIEGRGVHARLVLVRAGPRRLERTLMPQSLRLLTRQDQPRLPLHLKPCTARPSACQHGLAVARQGGGRGADRTVDPQGHGLLHRVSYLGFTRSTLAVQLNLFLTPLALGLVLGRRLP